MAGPSALNAKVEKRRLVARVTVEVLHVGVTAIRLALSLVTAVKTSRIIVVVSTSSASSLKSRMVAAMAGATRNCHCTSSTLAQKSPATFTLLPRGRITTQLYVFTNAR